jgi:hypothetical protein
MVAVSGVEASLAVVVQRKKSAVVIPLIVLIDSRWCAAKSQTAKSRTT